MTSAGAGVPYGVALVGCMDATAATADVLSLLRTGFLQAEAALVIAFAAHHGCARRS